jgi:uncharacterized membrane protein
MSKRMAGRLFSVALLIVLLIVGLIWWSFVSMFNGPYEGGVSGVIALVLLLLVIVGSMWVVIAKTKGPRHE